MVMMVGLLNTLTKGIADEFRLGSIGSGHSAGKSDSEDMSTVTHVSSCSKAFLIDD